MYRNYGIKFINQKPKFQAIKIFLYPISKYANNIENKKIRF